VIATNNTRIQTTHIFLVYVMEAPDIPKGTSLANSGQQEDQFAAPQFSSVFTTFSPKHLFAFTRTKFTAVAIFTSLYKRNMM
jgi:hypothetical protein